MDFDGFSSRFRWAKLASGCDLLGQSQPEDLPKLGQDMRSISHTVSRLKLDGLVVWGGLAC